ncbi:MULTISPECIES: AMP-binding protein [Methylobacterium]|uniref:Acetyl-coenzyme A synthetase n=4 Tax=Pseudomonadota TaxID=1224 RepID=A0ABQ4SX39_9HYPH|nr:MULTISPECIES: AMP-binding protein [Methylobacterium]GBU19086.1 propionate--CoA ligase [Methylobacterium sp.]GJE06453.1 Acetyl-coenzyme A synthetase [Methylobacterium jeotgali]
MLLRPAPDYESLREGFRWDIPERFNMGVAVCDRFGSREFERPAILELAGEGVRTVTYGQLRRDSNRLAHALARQGIAPGDRVAVLLPQTAAVVVAHAAAYKLGAIALPLAGLFGAEALAYRLADSGARAAITDAAGAERLAALRGRLPELRLVVSLDGPAEGTLGHDALVADADPDFAPRDTGADDPALMIYTSGTTGTAKGALHAHRVLPGHMPGFLMMHDFPPKGGDVMWTPSDWAWAGGLLNVVMPSLWLGVPVVAWGNTRFTAEGAFALIERMGVTNCFLPPTALRMLRSVENPRTRYDLSRLRNVASAGEALGPETFAWAERALGLTIGEAYGQTECNLVLASCRAAGVARAGSTGRPVPGHAVAVLRPDGSEAGVDEPGEIAVKAPDPVMFLRYWNRPEDTERKFRDGWLLTGDTARRDADGYVHFVGRDDDLITSAAYRIGPTEIEDGLLRHPAVALAAAVGKPDALRTEIVKAFVVLREGFSPSEDLAQEILAFGRSVLSAHEAPREIAFRESLPMTTTGKIIRRALRDEGAV